MARSGGGTIPSHLPRGQTGGLRIPLHPWYLVREPAVEKKIKIQHGLLADDKPQSRYHAMADPSCEAERAKLEAWRAGR